MLKKITIILLVALFVMTGVVGATALIHTNSFWKGNVTTMNGKSQDIFDYGQEFMIYTYGDEITPAHSVMKYRIVHINKDAKQEVLYSGNDPITEGDRMQNNPFITMIPEKSGPYLISLSLETGQQFIVGVYVLNEEQSVDDFDDLTFDSKDEWLSFAEEHYIE